MNRRLFHFLLIITWTGGSILAGGCRQAAPLQPSASQATPHQETPTLAAKVAQPVESVTQDVPQNEGSSIEEFEPLQDLAELSFDDFLEESFQLILLRDPEWVTSEGLSSALNTNNAQLTDISATYQEESLERYRLINDLLAAYDRASLTAEQQVSFDAYQWYLDDLLLQGEFRLHSYLVNPIITGIQYQLQYLFTDLQPLTSHQEARDYISRLSQVELKIDQLIESLQASQEQAIYPPQVALDASLGGIQGIAFSSPEGTPFYRTFQDKLPGIEGLSETEQQGLLDEARDTVKTSVIPAYQKLAEYLDQMETLPTGNGGVWQHPDGEAYYQAALRHHTTTDLTAEEIHQLGLEALASLQAEMRQRFLSLGYPPDESITQLYQRVAQESGFVQGDSILEGYQVLIDEASGRLDSAFDLQPAAELEVRAGPGSTAFYVSPAVDGSRPGVFYAPIRGSEPRFKMPTLAYHEGVPGHHFQISLMQELGLPLFHSLAGFTAYLEGWALYAERLAAELGWYADDPYGDLGRLQMEAFRAARLVVDTGLHAKRWTFNQAVDYLVENTGLDRNFLQNEVVRYLVWPGQATSYSVGYFKLLELRQRAMDVLGEGFDLKEFHRTILANGSLPLGVLERVVDEYITLASLSQLSDYPLYILHYQGDYGFGEFLETGVSPVAMGYDLPLAIFTGVGPAWACTGFAALNPAGDILLGRNFDWLQHPALLLFTSPREGYASVSMVDLHYLGVEGQVEANEQRNLLRAPYLPFDGMNERGLAVSMMAVPQADSGYDPGRVTISDLNLIRLLLDYAASVDEALLLIGEYNIDFGGGPPLHYFLADSSGASVVVEFVEGEMRQIPNQHAWQVATNYLISVEQPLGATSSCWRYNRAYTALEGAGGSLNPVAAMDLLESVSQPGEYATRWSVVYNLSRSAIQLAVDRDYQHVIEEALK